MTFETVFNAADPDNWNWASPVFFLIGIPTALLIIIGRKLRIFSIYFGIVVIVSILLFLFTYLDKYVTYRTVVKMMSEHNYSVAEGTVSDFVPMPYTGHAVESFALKGKRFSYSDFISTYGFHNTSSHGGPIREGIYVRIAYVDNTILRLEIAK